MEWAKFRRLVDDTVAPLKAADAVSSPGIPERAGYRGYACEQMRAVFDRLSKERFGG